MTTMAYDITDLQLLEEAEADLELFPCKCTC